MIPILKAVDTAGCGFCRFQLSFVSGKQHGKRRKRHFLRYNFLYIAKCLTVCDHQRRLYMVKRLCQLCFPCHNCDHAMIQQISEHLLLWQDQASLRCRCINWRYQYDDISRLHQIADDRFFRTFSLCQRFLFGGE